MRPGGAAKQKKAAFCHLRDMNESYKPNGIADSFHLATQSELPLVDPDLWLKGEAPVEDLLDDPIVALVMAHDRVSPAEVRALLAAAADRLARARVEEAA